VTDTATAPLTVAEVDQHAVYPLKVAAKLLGLTPVTFLKYAQPDGIIRPTPTSWKRVKGSEILRQFGQRVIDRAARTGERGETQAEREKRAAAAVARILAK
jgi:hypothetical protein